MDIQFSWFFDALVVCLFLIFIYIGGKRGFLGSVLILCSYILSALVAFIVANSTSPIVYDRAFSEKILTTIESKIENVDISEELEKAINRENIGIKIDKETVSDIIDNSENNVFDNIKNKIISELEGTGLESDGITQKMDDIFNNNIIDKFLNLLPRYVSDIIKESLNKGSDTFSEIVKILNNKSGTAASYIENKLVRPAVISIIATALFVVTFIIVRIITGLLFGIIKGVNKLPIVGSLDTFLGMTLGILEAVLVILLIVMALKFLIAFTNNDMIAFNIQNIKATHIFKWFYDLIEF